MIPIPNQKHIYLILFILVCLTIHEFRDIAFVITSACNMTEDVIFFVFGFFSCVRCCF